jgi:hypothetical protein
LLAEQSGAGILAVGREFEHPARLLINITASGETLRRPQIEIYGDDTSGKACLDSLSETGCWHSAAGC